MALTAVRSEAMVLLLFIVTPLWEFVIVLCFIVRNFMPILALQSS